MLIILFVGMGESLNIMKLYFVFKYEEIALDYSIKNKIIYRKLQCPDCNGMMCIYYDKYRRFQMYHRCTRCGKKVSIFYFSIFSCAKLPMNLILYLLYCWSNKFSGIQTSKEVDVNPSTVTFYFKQFRSACLEYLINKPQAKIGGIGTIVEIDETIMSRRKYHRGRVLQEVWIFGGICRETKQVFSIVVKDRKKETLWEEIKKHIAVGTTIISDSWGSYVIIENKGKKMFKHLSVNHSVNFVDPTTKAHTQNVERLWRELKKINKRYEGIPRVEISSHLAEFMWRLNEVRDQDPFIKAIELISNTAFYPNGNQDDD